MDLSDNLAQLSADGYTVLDSVVPDEVADSLLASVASLTESLGAKPSGNRFEGSHTTRIYNLLARDPIWQQVATHPMVNQLVKANLGSGHLISSLASIAIHPGEAAQVIHSDDQMFPIAKPHVPLVCNSMWALTDFTEANGATRIVPGSHGLDSPSYTDSPDVDSIPALMTKGSILVWTGSLWHGGGANKTDQDRVGVAMNYCAGFLRQQENQQLGIPTETMATFSPELRQLCGLGMYRGLTGHIDKDSAASMFYGDSSQRPMWDKD